MVADSQLEASQCVSYGWLKEKVVCVCGVCVECVWCVCVCVMGSCYWQVSLFTSHSLWRRENCHVIIRLWSRNVLDLFPLPGWTINKHCWNNLRSHSPARKDLIRGLFVLFTAPVSSCSAVFWQSVGGGWVLGAQSHSVCGEKQQSAVLIVPLSATGAHLIAEPLIIMWEGGSGWRAKVTYAWRQFVAQEIWS